MRWILIGLFLAFIVHPAASQNKKDKGDKANTISPQTLDLLTTDYFSRGNAAFNKELFDQAIIDYTKAIAEMPANANIADTAEIYTNRGAAYYRKGRYAKAVSDETKAIALAPGAFRAFNLRAWMRHQKGENARALPDANKALELAPVDLNNLETRAEIYEKLGHREKAIADYRAALQQDPRDKDSLAGLKRLRGMP